MALREIQRVTSSCLWGSKIQFCPPRFEYFRSPYVYTTQTTIVLQIEANSEMYTESPLGNPFAKSIARCSNGSHTSLMFCVFHLYCHARESRRRFFSLSFREGEKSYFNFTFVLSVSQCISSFRCLFIFSLSEDTYAKKRRDIRAHWQYNCHLTSALLVCFLYALFTGLIT